MTANTSLINKPSPPPPPSLQRNVGCFSPHAAISKWEFSICFAIFFVPLTYGVINIAQISAVIRDNAKNYLYLDAGVLFSRYRDGNDHEWIAFESMFKTFIFWCLVNSAVSWLFYWTGLLQFHRWSALLIGFSCLMVVTGIKNACIVLFNIVLSYAGMYFLHPWIFGWLVAAFMIIVPAPFDHADDGLFSSFLGNAHAKSFSYWHNAWNVMRIVGFGCEWHWKKTARSESSSLTFSFWDLLAFCFYSPTLFGPLVAYPEFHRQVVDSNSVLADKTSWRNIFSIREFATKLLVVVAWGVCVLTILEFLYIYIMADHLPFIKLLNGYGAASFTWIHGQYFQAKYMVIYGVPWLMAYLDLAVRLPPLPIFISRVYLYSAMWKYFDNGLYDFMKRYIYVPLGGSQHFMMATTGVFTFIFAWHGLSFGLAIWAFVNFCQVVGEVYIRKSAADPSSFLTQQIHNKLSPMSLRRLKALLCALSFQASVSVISIFLMGRVAGEFITRWTLLTYSVNYFVHLLAAYCWVQTVFSWENWHHGHPV